MVNIEVYQQLTNRALSKHKYLENIKKLYKSSDKCDDQNKYKDIIESGIFSTPEGLTKKSQQKWPHQILPRNLAQ